MIVDLCKRSTLEVGVRGPFDEANYEGNLYLLGDLGDGNCETFGGGGTKRSYRNGQKFEGYLYEGANCAGLSSPAPYNSENPNIGFDAHSFKQTRVFLLPPIGGRSLGLPIG